MEATNRRHGRQLTVIGALLLLIAQSPLLAESASHDGLPVGFTEEGHPFIGDENAAVILEEWSDYLCPFCYRHFKQTLPTILDKYVRPGDMKIIFRDLPLASLHPTAVHGHVAAGCAGRQGAPLYWAMHDALFARQSAWSRLPEPAAFLADVAREIGVDMVDYEQCLQDGNVAEAVAASVEEGTARGYSGTPSFRFTTISNDKTYQVIGAQQLDRFARIADPLVAGDEPPEDPKPEPPDLPLWAKPDGLAPDPDRPGFNMAGDPYKGNPDAKITVVEFTDFQCPACRTHALEAQPIIDSQLVDTGKVLWVEKHFPLRIHDQAALAAVAAECAGEQGRYWAMQKTLHAEQERWANDDAVRLLPELARTLGLNVERFQACFDGREALSRVLDDLYDAQGVITRAPTFVIIQDGRGTAVGPLAADRFVSLLKQRLDAAQPKSDASGQP